MKAKKRNKQRKKPVKPSLELIERKTPIGRIITFPGVQGRTVETIRLFTNTDDHSISIYFQDQTLFNLSVEPRFVFEASLADVKTGDFRTIKEWPPIASQPVNPE